MFKIAICDDYINHSFKMEELIDNALNFYEEEASIDVFEKPQSLLKKVKTEHYNVIILDIEMPTMNGLELAEKIRNINKNVYIVFVTNYSKYTLKSFEIQPFRYLLKPIDKLSIFNLVKNLIIDNKSNNKFLTLKNKSGIYSFNYNDIIFLTSELGRKVKVVTQSNHEYFYGKISEIEKDISSNDFARINQNVIVNFSSVYKLSSSDIVLFNGMKFTISRSRVDDVKSKYSLFLKRRVMF